MNTKDCIAALRTLRIVGGISADAAEAYDRASKGWAERIPDGPDVGRECHLAGLAAAIAFVRRSGARAVSAPAHTTPDDPVEPRLAADTVAWLRERHPQWQAARPWYRQGPVPVEVVPVYLSLERAIRELRAELADAYAQRDRQRDKADVASRLYLDKQSEWARDMFRMVRYAAESGVKLPTDEEEAAGRTLDVFVREIARGYKRARLALVALQQRRDVDRWEIQQYRDTICLETTCTNCAQLLLKMHELEDGPEGVRALRAESLRRAVSLLEGDAARACARGAEEIERLTRELADANASKDRCVRALAFWGVVLGYEPGRQVNQMLYWTEHPDKALLPPAVARLAHLARIGVGELGPALERLATALRDESTGLLGRIATVRAMFGWTL